MRTILIARRKRSLMLAAQISNLQLNDWGNIFLGFDASFWLANAIVVAASVPSIAAANYWLI